MPKAKCTKEIIERVRVLVERGQPWSVIAKTVGVAKSTMENWRNKDSNFYNKKFAKMVKEAKEQFDCGEIRKCQAEQAKKHKLRKVTKELVKKGPKKPPASYTKALLIRYADEVLDLILYKDLTKAVMMYECERRVEELTKEEMVITKTEESQVDPNQQAVKNVLTNTGPDDERWTFEEKHKVEPGDGLTKLMKEIGTSKSLLPSEQVVNGD